MTDEKLPELKIKTKGQITDIFGKKVKFTVGRYVTLRQSDYRKKIFVLQEIFFEDGRQQIRIGYYIIGEKPKMRGKWVWGQFCPFFPPEDLKELIRRAEEKGII